MIAEGVVVLRLAQHQLIGGVVHAGVLVQVDDQSHIRGIFRLGEYALVERRLNGGPDCGVGKRRRSVADETVADEGAGIASAVSYAILAEHVHEPARQPVAVKLVQALARELLDAWNARDISRFLSLLAEDVVWYDPGMAAPPAKGRGAVRAFVETVLAAFPDFKYTFREPLCVSADGRRCVFPWRITATASGWMKPPGFAPTGQRVQFDGVDLLDCEEGKIVRIETYFDALPAAEQLMRARLRPRPGSFVERLLVLLQRSRAAWLRRRTAH